MVERIAQAIFAAEYDETSYTMTRSEKVEYTRMARAAIEAMREVPSVVYAAYRCDEQWKDLNSTKVWNLWIDAILNESKS